jgi:DNA-binding phage protein
MGQTKKYREHLLKSLEDGKETAAYLDTCLEDEEPQFFLFALKDVAEVRGSTGNYLRRLLLIDRFFIDLF